MSQRQSGTERDKQSRILHSPALILQTGTRLYPQYLKPHPTVARITFRTRPGEVSLAVTKPATTRADQASNPTHTRVRHSTVRYPNPCRTLKQSEEIAGAARNYFFWSKFAVISTQMNYNDVDDSVSFHILFEKISIYFKYRYTLGLIRTYK